MARALPPWDETRGVDPIDLDVDSADPELVRAVADVVSSLTSEHHDLADPLTAIEADRRICCDVPDASIEYEAPGLFRPPVWRIRRDAND